MIILLILLLQAVHKFCFPFQFQDFRFLCPNDTVFDQQNLVCTNWFEVDCHQSVSFFFQGVGVKTNNQPTESSRPDLNAPQEQDYDYNYEYTFFYEDDYDSTNQNSQNRNRFLANSTPSSTSGNAGVGGGFRGQSFQNNVNNGIEADPFKGPPITPPPQRPLPPLQKATTAIPISVTTTRRPPRVKSNIFANGKPKKRPSPTVRPEVPIEFSQPDITEDRSKDPFRNPPLLSADGKKPRVKSNLLLNKPGSFSKSKAKIGSKASQKVSFNKDRFKFVTPEEVVDYETEIGTFEQTLSTGPEVRPDGKRPRVKSNLEAIRNNQGRRVQVTTAESLFNAIPTSRPLDPAPTVEPARENINEFSSFPFIQQQRPPGSAPRVKSDRNRDQSSRRIVPQNELPGALSINRFPAVSSTTAAPDQVTSTQRPIFSSTLLSIFDNEEPEFVDEIDEFVRPRVSSTTFRPPRTRPPRTRPPRPTRPSRPRPRPTRPTRPSRPRPRPTRPNLPAPTARPAPPTPAPRPFSNENSVTPTPSIRDFPNEFSVTPTPSDRNFPNQVTVTPRTRPRVKSNVLATRKNRFRKKKKQKEQSRTRFNNINFVSNDIDDTNEIGFSSDDRCSNPFKCPPKKTAGGRKPRVKSNIKARRRNYFHPSTGKTNRIRGRPTFKQQQRQQRFNKGKQRQGKAQRPDRRPFEKVSAVSPNSIPIENKPTPTPFIQTTTESLLQTLLQQIEEEKKVSQSPFETEDNPQQEALVFRRPNKPNRNEVVQKPLRPPQRPLETQTSPKPPPAIHFTSSAKPFEITTTQSPFSSSLTSPEGGFSGTPRPQNGPSQRPFTATRGPSQRPFSATGRPSQRPFSATRGPSQRPFSATRGTTENPVTKGPSQRPFSATRGPSQRPVTATRGPADRSFTGTGRPTQKPFSTTSRPFSASTRRPKALSTPSALLSTPRPNSVTKRPRKTLSTTRRPISSTTLVPEYEYEYYYEYEYEDEDYTDPPPRTTTSVPTSGASLISQIPLVTSPIPKGPVTLAPRTTVRDPKLPPIPTFSPRDLRKQRIQGHRLRPPKNFPSFPTLSTEPQQTRFPPKGRPEPENTDDVIKALRKNKSAELDEPVVKSDGRKPRVKSNLSLAKKNNRFKNSNKISQKVKQNDFRSRFFRNRNRFKSIKKEEESQLTTTTTAEPETTERPISETTKRPNQIKSKQTSDKSRLSFADLFGESSVRPDGRKPRVKSNIKQKLANNGRPFDNSHKIAVPSDLFEPKNHDKRKINTNNIVEELNEILSPKVFKNATSSKKSLLQQLKSGDIDPIKINQSSGDNEPVVRPDGQKPRVKSNILANQNSNYGGGGKKKNYQFRHSKKVESASFVFEPTTLKPLDETTTLSTTEEDNGTELITEPSSTEVPFSSSTPSTSILDVFLSTQVLNTRAVDPTLASLHEKMKEEFIQQRQQTKRRKRKSKKKELRENNHDDVTV